MKVIKTIAAVALLAFSSAAAVADDATWTSGEIKKIDTAQSKLTIKHGEIMHLDMPSMTMVFFVPDPKTLEGLKKGDKKQFDFADMNGRLVVRQVK